MGLSSGIWIGAGLLLSVFSWIFNKQSDSSAFSVFFLIGILFFLIGVMKLFISGATGPPAKKKNVQKIPGVRRCPACKSKNHHISNFCHKCGYKLGEVPPEHAWL